MGEMTLVILAAGDGGRLGQQKALLEFGGRCLLEHIIDAFQEWTCGVVIVVGSEGESIWTRMGSSRNGNSIYYVVNPDWATTKTGDSLYLAQLHWSRWPCIVVSGDHLFSRDLVSRLMSSDAHICVLADGRRDLDGEETVLIGDSDGYVKSLVFPSSTLEDMTDLRGECPEIFKLSSNASMMIVDRLPGLDVFEAVNQFVGSIEWFPTNEPWIEIDTPEDLERAREVWKQIEASDDDV